MRGHGEHAVCDRLHGIDKSLPASVALRGGIFVVIQARTTHVAVFHGEPQWLNQVQAAAGVGAKADHIAGIGGDFWLDQDDVEHGMQ